MEEVIVLNEGTRGVGEERGWVVIVGKVVLAVVREVLREMG